jgi:hypothetical protein
MRAAGPLTLVSKNQQPWSNWRRREKKAYQDWLEAPLNRADEFVVPYSADELVAMASPIL